MPEGVPLGGSPPALEVLARPAFSNRRKNPYNARVYGTIGRHGVRVREFSPARALLGRPADIVHVHWPESSLNHGLVGGLLTTELLLAALGAQKARGARLVWTMHNLRAHERRYPEVEERFWRRYLPMVDGVIAHSPGALARGLEARPELASVPSFVVRHPHYRGAYPDTLDRAAARRLLGIAPEARVIAFFGHVKAYKNVPALVHAARALPPDVVLLVAGAPRDASLARAVEEAAGGDPRVKLHLAHVPDDETQRTLRASDLVALPYTDILSSGTALLALSFDRPVLLPPGQTADDLRALVGAAWVRAEALSPAALAGALEAAASLPERTDGAFLAALAPDAIAAETAAVYRSLRARAGAATRRPTAPRAPTR